MSPTQLGKPFGYPAGKPRRIRREPDTLFVVACVGAGFLVGAASTFLFVLWRLR